MRFLPSVLACACLLAVPGAAAQEPTLEVWLEDPEETVDELLDMTVMLDAHLGDTGSCLRQGAVSEAKTLYGDDDLHEDDHPDLTVETDWTLGEPAGWNGDGTAVDTDGAFGEENPVVDCVAAQCVGWPPRPFVSTANCVEMVQETLRDLFFGIIVTEPLTG